MSIAFPSTVAVSHPSVPEPKGIDNFLIAGFASGDGTFKIIRKISKRHKAGNQIYLIF